MTLSSHTRQRWVHQLPDILADPQAMEALWLELGALVAKAAATRREFDQALAEVRVAALRQGYAEGLAKGAEVAAKAKAEVARRREAEALVVELQSQLCEVKNKLAASNRVGDQMRRALDDANRKLRATKKAG